MKKEYISPNCQHTVLITSHIMAGSATGSVDKASLSSEGSEDMSRGNSRAFWDDDME